MSEMKPFCVGDFLKRGYLEAPEENQDQERLNNAIKEILEAFPGGQLAEGVLNFDKGGEWYAIVLQRRPELKTLREEVATIKLILERFGFESRLADGYNEETSPKYIIEGLSNI